jgi:hypothetical protein
MSPRTEPTGIWKKNTAVISEIPFVIGKDFFCIFFFLRNEFT